MSGSGARHRVIGIRHTLKQLKKAGLVEEEREYPQQAVEDIQSEVLSVAQRWYGVGAKRGALEMLEAFLDGQFEVHTSKSGKREVIASTESVTWTKRLNVTVGNKKQQVAEHAYELTLKDLGFDG